MQVRVKQVDDDVVKELELVADPSDQDETDLLERLSEVLSTHDSDLTLTIRITDGLVTSCVEGVNRG